ncbi:AAC(3) family N-acetyltransferase [Pseudovibrio sp. JE062]|uniref:AAC(3) family N-acetyltransferase n=1 Tax=Pseudovibrio sp. JE062 TaxID=439495 RepID=UPI000186C467|nr:AAC(3) family N-acetyltransferase [Pseudovibrio sp. JE062]EEA92903.1 conserved hypothetical protein [Pseudovibrio sp. JE062]
MQEPLSDLDFLLKRWEGSGLQKGDTVLLHSSILRTLVEARRAGRRGLTAEQILESFLALLGEEGTLLLPLFNFDFAEGKPFVFDETPSQMGALTEAGRKYPGAVRTGHPVYSFCVIGKEAPKFRHLDNKSGYGADSPFGLLRELDGKIAVLDLPDEGSMTFYHHIEEMNRVNYRYSKDFTAPYTDERGVTTDRTYSIYVRDLDMGVVTNVDPAGEVLWSKGLYSGSRPNEGGGLRSVRAQIIFEVISELIQNHGAENLLYNKGLK